MAGSFRSFALRGAGVALIIVAFPVLVYGIILVISEYRPTDTFDIVITACVFILMPLVVAGIGTILLRASQTKENR